MSTGTALTQTTEPAPRAVASLAGGMVSAIVPKTFDDVYRFAQVVAQSGLCPHGMDTPQKVTVAILTGLEIGVKPMQAVQGIAVIGGRPCVWGDLALGVVRGSGELEWIKEFYEGDIDSVDWAAPTQSGPALKVKAICIVKRKGEPETRNEFSIGDAVVAKLWGKRGYNGKDTPWITNPKRMLKMRARGFGLRDQFTDVLKGLYIAEELIGTEVDQPERSGIVAPPPPPPAIESLPQEPAPPANTNAGPAAPPAEKVEEAEIVEEAAGHNFQMEEHELLTKAGAFENANLGPVPSNGVVGIDIGRSGATQHPPLAQEEPFDPEAWLDEARERFQEAKTEADVSDVHEMFADTANDLGMTDRQKYEDMLQAAEARVRTQGQPEQAQVTGEPGPAPSEDDEDDIPSAEQPAGLVIPVPAEAYYHRINEAVTDPIRTYESIAGLWKATKPERDALLQNGSLSRDRMKEMQASIKARYAKEFGDPAQQAQAAPPAGPGPSAPPAEEDEVAAYDRSFRARVEACKTIEEIGALSAGTLAEHAKFAGDPLQAVWKNLVADRRKAIAGIA